MNNKGNFVKVFRKTGGEDLIRREVICALKEEEKGLDREEEELEKHLKELRRKEMELKVHLMKLELDKAKVGDEAKRVNMDCSWYADEMKFLFCKEFVLEVVFKVEEEMIAKEERGLDAIKGPSFGNYEKILKSFEYLQKLEKESGGKDRKNIRMNKDRKDGIRLGLQAFIDGEDKKRSESEKNCGRGGGFKVWIKPGGNKKVNGKCLTPTRQILKALG